MGKPARPPDKLNEQFTVTSAVLVQEPGEPAELKGPGEPAELEEPGEPAELKEPGKPAELGEPEVPGRPEGPGESRESAELKELQGMRRAREGGTAAKADTVRVRREAERLAEDTKMDPSNCLMEILTLKENQEGIRIRRSPGDYVEHLPRVLKRVFPRTLCRPVNDEQGGCASSKVRGSDGQCASSGVRQSGDPGGGPEPEAKCKPACGKPLGVLDENPPAARYGRLTMSGMSAGATVATTDGPVAPLPGEPMLIRAEVRAPHPAELLVLQVPSQRVLEAGAATSRDQAQGAIGSVARYELQPSRKEGSRDEPPLGGLWKGADETGQQGGHTRSCAASKLAPECGATSAAHPDVPPGTNPAAVATTQRQMEGREKAAAEQLPERGSPVGVQQALPQEGAAREAGEEQLPERGSPVGVQLKLHQEMTGREAGAEQLPEQGGPVEVQLKLCQEESWAEARRGQRKVGQRPVP
jgi:hypothetical protein